jgi:hypothetical protein
MYMKLKKHDCWLNVLLLRRSCGDFIARHIREDKGREGEGRGGEGRGRKERKRKGREARELAPPNTKT